ncbi:hypothetical protein BV22DRAFT_1119794 [Leucogyrophana mollusca]|uniref:Uncharacterized protein n=1 Tax=Leucogyrophana mollusca TaxID=85980 RepID=A0ACB8BGX8_9AGAM|nr:hypothetical protein BV22DRAFT_1119794 [Leucogyrophana mollusca]
MRPLTLHVSALNDAEYKMYTESLNDLTVTGDDDLRNPVHDDAYYDRMIVGVREARAWLRGRYSDLPVSDIDSILKFFSPNMLHSDCLTGGQFFAALRLVIHAQGGKGVDRTLVFVQTHPPTKTLDPPRPPSPAKRQAPYQVPPSHPDCPRQRPTSSSSSSPDTNPFTRRSLEQSKLPLENPDAPPICPPRLPPKISHNPFLMRDKHNGAEPYERGRDAKSPPLIPRKPAPLTVPVRRASSALPPSAHPVTYPPSAPPRVPTKPSHITSQLMKQSLEASKQGQSMKRVEDQLDKERILQVLKSTSSSSSDSSRTRSLSPSKQPYKDYPASGSDDAPVVPPLPRRRTPRSPPSSSSGSTPSLDQVASATVAPFSPSLINAYRPALPSRDSTTSNAQSFVTVDSSPPTVASSLPAPPTHPDRRPSNDTFDSASGPFAASPRVSRSKSMHHSTTTTPPLPPPRRRRPESVQLSPVSSSTEVPTPSTLPPTHARTASYQGLSRHLSLSRETDTSPIANLQRTFTSLQQKARPKFDVARYKAEAGLTRRGYVNHSQLGGPGARWMEEGEERLMVDSRWAAAGVDRDPHPAPDTDDSSGDERASNAKNGAVLPDYLKQADNLKWPAGEGWKPL